MTSSHTQGIQRRILNLHGNSKQVRLRKHKIKQYTEGSHAPADPIKQITKVASSTVYVTSQGRKKTLRKHSHKIL